MALFFISGNMIAARGIGFDTQLYRQMADLLCLFCDVHRYTETLHKNISIAAISNIWADVLCVDRVFIEGCISLHLRSNADNMSWRIHLVSVLGA